MINDPKKILELVRQGKLVEAAFLYDVSFTKFEQNTSYLKFGVQLFFELGRRERCLHLLDRMSRLSPIEPEAALFPDYVGVLSESVLGVCPGQK